MLRVKTNEDQDQEGCYHSLDGRFDRFKYSFLQRTPIKQKDGIVNYAKQLKEISHNA